MKNRLEPEEVISSTYDDHHERYFCNKHYCKDTRKILYIVYKEYDDHGMHEYVEEVFQSFKEAKEYIRILEIPLIKAKEEDEKELKLKKTRQDKIEIQGYKERNNLTDERIGQELRKKDSELNNILKHGRPEESWSSMSEGTIFNFSNIMIENISGWTIPPKKYLKDKINGTE